MRAVGYNPEAARYGGINVRKNLTSARWRSRARSPASRGGLDMLGYLYRLGVSDIPVSQVGFLGIAVALLGRNTAVGVGFVGAPLRRAPLYGTTHGAPVERRSTRSSPSNLTYIIQGLIVLFVGADLLILAVWNSRKRLRRKPGQPETRDEAGGGDVTSYAGTGGDALWQRLAATPIRRRRSGSCSASWPASLALPPITARSVVLAARSSASSRSLCGICAVTRGERRASAGAPSSAGIVGDRPRPTSRPQLERRQPQRRLPRRPDRVDARLRDAARLRRASAGCSPSAAAS